MTEAGQETKLVRVVVAALTRVEHSTLVEVPANITESELGELAERVYDETDGSEFREDHDYWEQGQCYCRPAEPDEKPLFKVARELDGGIGPIEPLEQDAPEEVIIRKRRYPLPPGTLIEYRGERATVVEDTGGTTLQVEINGTTQTWLWAFEGHECTVLAFPDSEQEPDSTKILLPLSIFDDEGNQVDSAQCRLTEAQIADIVDHAAQLILICRSADASARDQAIAELEEALQAAGVV